MHKADTDVYTVNCKHNNKSLPNIFCNFISIVCRFSYISFGILFSKIPMMSMLLPEMIAIIPLLAFQIRSAFSDAEKLLHWITEYISCVSCLSRALCTHSKHFKAYCCFGGRTGQVFCIWHFRGKSGSHYF